jgi:hypothetical protein
MARWIFTFVLIYFIVRAITRFARGLFEGLNPPRERPPAAVPLVRDPECGTFVVPERAVIAGSGPDIRFFCSEKCRRSYEMRGGRQAGAATRRS